MITPKATDNLDLFGTPLERPLTQEEWDHANAFITGMRDEIEMHKAAADRFAKELADARIRLAMRDNEIERLREGIREVGFLAGSEVLRAMCEDLLLNDQKPGLTR